MPEMKGFFVDWIEKPAERKEKRDKTIVLLLVTFYLIVSFYHLGSLKAPQTYWQPSSPGEGACLDLGKEETIKRISFFGGLIGEGEYRLEYSADAETWQEGPLLKPQNVFEWKEADVDLRGRYIRIIAQKSGGMLNEIGFWGEKQTLLPVNAILPLHQGYLLPQGFPEAFDEQDTVPYQSSYLNSTYFDEIYFARTAYEYLHQVEPYEWTHPPLGKMLISLGITIFGMNPFGWRFMGVVFGALIIPLMYLLGKKLFGRSEYGLVAAFLMTFEFMHFVQARIATIDTYVVFFIILMYYFMLVYLSTPYSPSETRRFLLPLFLSGLSFGLGASVKWTGIYAGGGLAVLFFLDLVKKRKENPSSFATFCKKMFPWCVLFFIIVPLFVYCLFYVFFLPGPTGIRDIWRHQLQMFNYHSKLEATHPFSSPWWQWPLMIRPIWLYQGKGLPPGQISSIVSLGNPAIWWGGTLVLLFSLILPLFLKEKALPFILIGFLAQYLPWVLVPRLTFIYHFYNSVPFYILLIVLFYRKIRENYPRYKPFLFGYLALAAFLFFLFYPVLSGEIVSKNYVATYLRWLPSWTFFIN